MVAILGGPLTEEKGENRTLDPYRCSPTEKGSSGRSGTAQQGWGPELGPAAGKSCHGGVREVLL
jgi:hypothetical protein